MHMTTKTMHISILESLVHSVKERVKEGQYGNFSEYVRPLIREDLKRQAEVHRPIFDFIG